MEASFDWEKLQVFSEGQYDTKFFSVCVKPLTCSPPKPLYIVTPTVEGTYPVVLFFHGCLLRNIFYSDLLRHIASHGFIVVAPQFCAICWNLEVELAGAVVNWLQSGLQSSLPKNVVANLDKLVLAGHSRGGQTAFALALGLSTTTLKFSALVGIDPVDGANEHCGISGSVLHKFPNSFDLTIPVTVIGTGLGGEKRNTMMQPCAPEHQNHVAFFRKCNTTRAHFVAKDYGHMDMLNDNPPGIILGTLSGCMCKNGTGCRDRMRKCVGGIVVAFLQFVLNHHQGDKNSDFLKIVQEPYLAPVVLDQPEFIPV